MLKKIILSTLLLCSSFAFACDAHTWHTIRSYEGDWDVHLRFISEQAEFVNPECTAIHDGSISESNALTYGLVINSENTFDMAYTITATKKSENSFVHPTCVFIVGASAPAKPQIKIESYYGAHCSTQREQTLNFVVS